MLSVQGSQRLGATLGIDKELPFMGLLKLELTEGSLQFEMVVETMGKSLAITEQAPLELAGSSFSLDVAPAAPKLFWLGRA